MWTVLLTQLGLLLLATVLAAFYAPPFSISFSVHEQSHGWYAARVGNDLSLHCGRLSLILHRPDVLTQFMDIEDEHLQATTLAYKAGFEEGKQVRSAEDEARRQRISIEYGYYPDDGEEVFEDGFIWD